MGKLVMVGLRLLVLVLGVLSASCGGGGTGGQVKLALELGSDTVAIGVGETLLVQLLVVGAAGRPVSVSSADLPSFATIDGTMLRLAPSRAVSPGSYPLTLVASAGTDSATASLSVTVSRFNTPPRMSWQWWSDGAQDKATCNIISPLYGNRLYAASGCRFDGTPSARFTFDDDEKDALTLEVELVPVGTAFTGIATHTFQGVWQTAPVPYETSGVSMTLPNLADGTYAVAMRACDVVGACWSILSPVRPALPGNWVDVGEIQKGCPAGEVCGGPAGASCSAASDCVSRVCIPDAVRYVVWESGTCQ